MKNKLLNPDKDIGFSHVIPNTVIKWQYLEYSLLALDYPINFYT